MYSALIYSCSRNRDEVLLCDEIQTRVLPAWMVRMFATDQGREDRIGLLCSCTLIFRSDGLIDAGCCNWLQGVASECRMASQ
jgi:hypothetical protein